MTFALSSRTKEACGLLLAVLVLATGCHSDWRARAINDAEALVRSKVGDPALQFRHVQFTGDERSGQTCGYFVMNSADGGEETTRFIVWVDGGGGQTPWIDDSSAPYPTDKSDFGLNWQSQCVDLGYDANTRAT